MSEIVNCEYSKTIMEEPVCNAFDVNRYGEIICSEENCIILKLKEQLQTKEQECEELKHDLQNIQHNCTREGCKYYDDNTYKVFYNCKGKTELSKYKQALNEVKKILDNGAADTQTNNAKWIHQWYLARFCEIREIINKAKGE